MTIKFKNPVTQHMVVKGIKVTEENLTPKLYATLVRLAPHFAGLVNVVENKIVEHGKENTEDNQED